MNYPRDTYFVVKVNKTPGIKKQREVNDSHSIPSCIVSSARNGKKAFTGGVCSVERAAKKKQRWDGKKKCPHDDITRLRCSKSSILSLRLAEQSCQSS